jgi:toxin ParE2
MKVRLLADARAEMVQAKTWYAGKAQGLDRQFLEDLRGARQLIVEHPRAWQPLGDGVRRIRLKRFPYQLIYFVSDDVILVLAVAHLRRKPNYWRSRIPT